MTEPTIFHSPRPDATSDAVRDSRVRAWAFAFECYRKKSVPDRRPDDAERRSDEIGATASINEPPELLTVFDLLGPGACSLLCGTLRAWGRSARTEDIGYGRVVLVVRAGGGRKLAR